jgi:cold shock CspA family protein/ribosome-associated translation inhibitor RaiA
MLLQDIHIDGRNLEILPEWREKIMEELARLQKHSSEPLLHARVELLGTGHHRHGAFEIHLVVTLAGATLSVRHQGENVVPLIVEAFDAMDLQLREYLRQRRQQVKVHEEHCYRGTILRLNPEEDFGFLETADGTEVYFHAHALKNRAFEDLQEGQEVEFGLEEGDKGPQATWVWVMTER